MGRTASADTYAAWIFITVPLNPPASGSPT